MDSYGWRTLVVTTKSKLSFSENNLIMKTDEKEIAVPIIQLRTVMINSTEVIITSRLVIELNSLNVKIIFCDNKHNPCCETNGFCNNTYTSGRICEQIGWSEETKLKIWKNIIFNKISNQLILLQRCGSIKADTLKKLLNTLNEENVCEYEAKAARIYFSGLFGVQFNRRTESECNSALNYGYAIIMSAVNRAVTIHGYHTVLGINHCSKKNTYNLSCDIMEPFRPFIDDYVLINGSRELDWEYKKEIIGLGYKTILYRNKKTELFTAIDMYVNDVLNDLTKNSSKMGMVKFYE